MIVGNYDLPQQEATRFKTTMFGYGLGGIYRFPKGSFGVASLPPLRGKTDIFGEEKIVATPGELEFSADYAPTKEHRFGLQYATLQYKRDDLAEGTTIDNDSNAPISLTGLSYDRFLFPYRRIGLGYDHTFSSQMTGIFALYREESEFLFDPDSEPGDSDELLTMNSYTLKLNLKYTSGDLTFVGGLNFNEAETEFDRSDTAVTYESSTRTLHMVLEKSL